MKGVYKQDQIVHQVNLILCAYLMSRHDTNNSCFVLPTETYTEQQ